MKKHLLPEVNKKLESYMMSDANILIADIAIFDGYNEEGQIVQRDLTDDERFRKIYTINGRYFDLATGEEFFECDVRDDGYIYGEVFTNTKYVVRTWRTKKVTYNDVLRAALMFDTQLKTDELIAKRQILLLPRERLL